MGNQDSVPKSDPENPGSGHLALGASPHGETTLDTGRAGLGEAQTLDRPHIGPYMLLKKLGEGGMGQVWLADQMAPVKRQVALKLIKGALYDDAAIQRFQSERQSLAVMNHPAIAKVFDAGSTLDGQPYFVMEYVDGLTITRYCDNNRLKVRERLELFIKVCEGVQHAHQKAIIHRDLKPSNVLVSEVDGRPAPKIIDFGIAKAISLQPGAERTMFTQIGALVGTRGFMSPEQADPSILDMDTRTDVYSLGVILYVLLSGTLPFDLEEWKKKPFDEVLRKLREEDPPSPSTKLGGDKETATASAANRATTPKQLASLLRGDLDWITLRAVEKDRARRYGSPSELAADIERYLENRPVVARPASKSYRLKKYAQRHRVGVSVAASAVVLLVAFVLIQTFELRRITRERDRANRITDFMVSMFKISDPNEARGNTVTAREILDKASKEIDMGLAKDQELQAQLMQTMGDVYERLGLFSRGEALLAHAVAIRRRIEGPEHADTVVSMSDLAWALEREGQYAKAEKMYRETLDLERRVLGPRHPKTLVTMSNLGWTLTDEGRYAEAEKLYRETFDLQRRVLGPEHPDTMSTMDRLATALRAQGHTVEAEKLLREALEVRARVLGPEHPNTLSTINNLAAILSDEGRYAEAEKLQRESLDVRRRVLGPEHPDTLISMNNLANDLSDEGRYAEAEKLDRDALDMERRVLGPDHPFTVNATYNLACILSREGYRDEALSLLRDAVAHGLGASAALGIERDPDLKSLHGDSRFAALVAHAKERATAAQKTK